MTKYHWNTREGQQRSAKQAREALKIAGNFGSRSAYVRKVDGVWVTQFGSKRRKR